MKQHQYHVTVQHLKDAKGQASTYTERLEFYTGNHDDIFQIVERLKRAEFWRVFYKVSILEDYFKKYKH